MSRVLIVDSEQSVTDPLSYLLRQSGFDVIVVASASAIADLLAEVDIVLLDLELPDAERGGVELCREVRSASSVPIIVLTAVDEEDEKVEALEAGADDYVIKPFSSRELIARITAVLRRYGDQDQDLEVAVLTAGPLRIDVDRHQVMMNGEEIALRLKEFTVLDLLVRYRGQVVTRGQLVERIWGQRFDGDPKRVDAIINRLRGKLEADPADPRHLLTVRGVGYRFQT